MTQWIIMVTLVLLYVLGCITGYNIGSIIVTLSKDSRDLRRVECDLADVEEREMNECKTCRYYKECPMCGSEVFGDDLYCPECFEKVVADETIRQQGEEIQRLRARIAALEAEQQWHPASEPPKAESRLCCSKSVLVRYVMGFDEEGAIYDYTVGCYAYPFEVLGYSEKGNVWVIRRDDDDDENGYVTHWRDLPPMPEVET